MRKSIEVRYGVGSTGGTKKAPTPAGRRIVVKEEEPVKLEEDEEEDDGMDVE